jgi:hypothetical protein
MSYLFILTYSSALLLILVHYSFDKLCVTLPLQILLVPNNVHKRLTLFPATSNEVRILLALFSHLRLTLNKRFPIFLWPLLCTD